MGENSLAALALPLPPTPRKKKSSVYVYTRFPEINDNEEDDPLIDDSADLKGKPVHRRIQILGSVAANMGALALGTVLSWPAVALPSLRKDSDFKRELSINDESWIGSIVSLGAVAAGPVGGILIETLGRKMTMLYLSLPFFLGWVLIYLAPSIPVILAGRFVTGFFAGAFAVTAPIFTAEVTDIGIRGAVGSTFDMMISLGILFIYIIGTFLSWRTQALVCSIIPVVIFLLMLFVPESPVYLIKNGKMTQAAEALMRYRGADRIQQIHTEFADMASNALSATRQPGLEGLLTLLFTPYIILPVFIGFCIFMFQVISGLDPVLVYTVDIFHMAGADLNDYTSTIIIGTMQTLAGVVAASLVDRCGRRFLLLISEAMMVVALTMLGYYFYLKDVANEGKTPAELGWLPVTSLAIFVLSYSVGLGPVGYTLMGEILPLQVKGLAGCILTSAKWFMSFLATKFFQDLLNFLGHAGCFWLFASFCGMGFLFVVGMVPETKGKTLEEIQQGFRDRCARSGTGGSRGERTPLLVSVQQQVSNADNDRSSSSSSSDGVTIRERIAKPTSSQ